MKIQKPRSDSMLAEIMCTAIATVEKGEEAQAAMQALAKLLEKAAERIGEDKADEIDSQVTEVFVAFATGAFMWGWTLRDNPNLLASMLQGEA
jgi:hypothetical protein